MKNVLIIFILFLGILPYISNAQEPDSLSVLEFQNKRNPKKIQILKTGKRICLKLNSIYEGGKSYSIRGKLTSITDTSLTIDNKYVINPESDLISDYRFNNHILGKVILTATGAGLFIYGAGITLLFEVTLYEYPIFAIESGFLTTLSDVILLKSAFSKKKHLVKNWNISIKRVKNQSK